MQAQEEILLLRSSSGQVHGLCWGSAGLQNCERHKVILARGYYSLLG